MNGIGWAVKQMQNGDRVTRSGWGDSSVFLFVIQNWTYTDGKQDNFANSPFIVLKTTDGRVTPWVPTHTDLLAADWAVTT